MRDFTIRGPVYLMPMAPMTIAVYHLFKKHGVSVAGFCDNSARFTGKQYQGIPCMRPREAAIKDPNAIFIINSQYGRTQAALSQEAKDFDIRFIFLEQILERGDIEPILPDIAEEEACELLLTRIVRDVAELHQFFHILPDSWLNRGNTITSINLYPYRNMKRDFDELAHPDAFIRCVVITLEKNDSWEEIARYITQSGRNIGIIEIRRDSRSYIPVRDSLENMHISTPLYILSPVKGILSRNNIGAGIPIALVDNDIYPPLFDETKSIFVHIPKNSGSTLKTIFFSRLSKPLHVSARYYHDIDADKFDRYFSFAMVRNPWDRLVSSYTFCRENFLQDGVLDGLRKLCSAVSFRDMVHFLKEDAGHLLLRGSVISPQYEWVCNEDGKVMVDYIGRFENLNESYARIAQGMNIPWNGDIPHANASRHRPYQEYYDAETKAIIGKLFKTDIELFGYSFE